LGALEFFGQFLDAPLDIALKTPSTNMPIRRMNAINAVMSSYSPDRTEMRRGRDGTPPYRSLESVI